MDRLTRRKGDREVMGSLSFLLFFQHDSKCTGSEDETRFSYPKISEIQQCILFMLSLWVLRFRVAIRQRRVCRFECTLVQPPLAHSAPDQLYLCIYRPDRYSVERGTQQATQQSGTRSEWWTRTRETWNLSTV